MNGQPIPYVYDPITAGPPPDQTSQWLVSLGVGDQITMADGRVATITSVKPAPKGEHHFAVDLDPPVVSA